jgi:hypothetical protein
MKTVVNFDVLLVLYGYYTKPGTQFSPGSFGPYYCASGSQYGSP